MHDSGAVDDLAAQVAELMPAASAAGFAGPREPGERAGATAISRRTAGVALAGAAAGMVGAAVLSDRSGRSAAAPSGGGVRAELTAVDTPAATTPGRAGGISPAVVTLADEARISVDAA